MEAIRVCTNPDCKIFFKTHFKKDDLFCPKCGKELSFVCASCGKVMERGENKYCISCQTKIEQNRAQNIEKAKSWGSATLAFFGVAAAFAKGFTHNIEEIGDSVKIIRKIADNIKK